MGRSGRTLPDAALGALAECVEHALEPLCAAHPRMPYVWASAGIGLSRLRSSGGAVRRESRESIEKMDPAPVEDGGLGRTAPTAGRPRGGGGRSSAPARRAWGRSVRGAAHALLGTARSAAAALRRRALIHRREISVPVDETPVAVLASVDLGDPQPVRVRLAVQNQRAAFAADRVGQVGALVDHLVLRTHGAVTVAAGDPVERATHVAPSLLARAEGAELGDVVTV